MALSCDLEQQICAEIDLRADDGFTTAFTNGGHSIQRESIKSLVEAAAIQTRLRSGVNAAPARLLVFDPEI